MDKQISVSEQRRRKIRRGLPWIAGALAGIGAVVWLLGGIGSRSARADSVGLATAARGDISTTVSASGEIVAARQQTVSSPVASKIMEVLHRPGDRVEQGDELLVLDLAAARDDERRLADQLAMKELAIQQARAEANTTLARMEMEVRVAEMKENAAGIALANERRLDSLGSGTGERVREAEFNLSTARLSAEQARQSLANERTVRAAALEASMLEASITRRELAMARRTLGEARVPAPMAGTITSISEQIGAPVTAGQQIAMIADLSGFAVNAEVPASNARDIQPGTPVSVRLTRGVLSGHITNVVPVTASGSVSFRVALDNDTSRMLRAGLRPEVHIHRGIRSDVIRIPNGSYYNGPGNYSMFVQVDNRLVRRNVHLGEAGFDYVEVVSGIAEGERVATADMSDFGTAATITLK